MGGGPLMVLNQLGDDAVFMAGRLLLCAALLFVPSAARAELRIIPQPRQIKLESGRFPLQGGLTIAVPSGDAEDQFAARLLAAEIESCGVTPVRITTEAQGSIVLARDGAPPEVGDEGYRIEVRPNGVQVRAHTGAGLFYGVQTLRQMVEVGGIPAAAIVDWPALRWRGVHDDVSRGPMPTLESLKRRIRTAAEYKINLYALYLEQAFAYRSHPLMATPGGALTQAEIQQIVAYARLHHVDVLLEQQTLGHLDRLLDFETYQGLAESPNRGMLSPAVPGSYALVESLYREIVPLGSAPFFHVGADEPSALGEGRSKRMVDSLGAAAVYYGYLQRLQRLLAPHHKRLMFWGDFALKHPERLASLSPDAVAASWSSDALESFDLLITPFREAKLDVFVCPGVSNWNRVFPNLDTATPNIRGFTRDGQRLGAIGQLNCTWDDNGDALFGMVWYPVVYGAAAAWQAGDCDPARFRAAFDWAFFRNPGHEVADAIERINSAHALLQSVRPTDATVELTWLNPAGHALDRRLLAMLDPVAARLRTAQETAITLIGRGRARAARNVDLLDYLELAARRLHAVGFRASLAVRLKALYLDALDAPREEKSRAVSDLRAILGLLAQGRERTVEMRDEYERLWLAENRPHWLGNILAQFNYDTQLWQQKSDELRARAVMFRNGVKLPPAEEIGFAP